MVFQVALRWLTFKQDISDINQMLDSQTATYAVLRYAYDIPEPTYKKAMDDLAINSDAIDDRRLSKLIEQWIKVNNVGLQDWDEEVVGVFTADWETGEMMYVEGDTVVWQNTVPVPGDASIVHNFEEEDDDELTLCADNFDLF